MRPDRETDEEEGNGLRSDFDNSIYNQSLYADEENRLRPKKGADLNGSVLMWEPKSRNATANWGDNGSVVADAPTEDNSVFGKLKNETNGRQRLEIDCGND